MPRGKQKKPTWVHINLRVSREVFDYFSRFDNMSEAIRNVLEAHTPTPNIVRGDTQLEAKHHESNDQPESDD